MENRMENSFIDVSVEDFSGQSLGKTQIFQASYLFPDNKIISEQISSITSMLKNEVVEHGVYVSCEDEQLKLDIISEVVRKNPPLKIRADENVQGMTWGVNILVAFNEPSKDKLTSNRNKLNRQISKLKKATREE